MENVPSETTTTAGEEPPQKTQKKGRHRKKQLFSSILQQMEFYFSDSNLTKDRFLAQLINENPYVNLEVFLKFNKIRKLTSNLEDLQKALKKSELIELSEDKTSVRRKNPVVEKPDVDGCTIYVQQLPLDFNHDRLTAIFSDFGKVVYVSIPRYKKTNAIKGFAFVEFDKEQEARNALDYFEKIGQKMPASTEPEKLCSIATFEADTDKVSSTAKDKTAAKTDESQTESVKAEDKGDPEQTSPIKIEGKTEAQPVEEKNVKKRKASEDSDSNIKIEPDDDQKPTKKIKTSEEEVTAAETKPVAGETEETKKKKKKKDKKKTYIKELGIQILSKKEWKKMRNRYLDMQRKRMKEFKQHLAKARFARQQQQQQANNNLTSNDEEEAKSTVKNMNSENDTREINNDEHGATTELPAKDEATSKIEFVKGVIVKLTLPEVIEDVKKLKNDIRSSSADIKFVDASLTSQDVYIRFGSQASAEEYCAQPAEEGTTRALLRDEEEKLYWDKLRQDREAKFKKCDAKKKHRGRDKLLKKANKMLATHIKFEET